MRKRIIRRCIKKAFSVLPVRKKKIIFDNFLGNGYGDNPKCIAEKLLGRGLDLVWIAKNNNISLPDGIRAVKYGSLRMFYEISTSKVWVFNTRNVPKVKKKKSQVYLQTWHGSLFFKRIEAEAESQLLPVYVRAAKKDGRICDAVIAGNSMFEQLLKEKFWLGEQAEILKIGEPRHDIFFDKEVSANNRHRIRLENHIKEEDILVLYAPTFRDNNSNECYDIDFEGIIREFEAIYNRKVYVLIKLHPNAAKYRKIFEYNSHILDGNDYSDTVALYQASDIMISDFSNAAIDFSRLLRKPVFLLALDCDEYIHNREASELWYDIPFVKAKTNEEMLSSIRNYNESEYIKRIDDFWANYHFYDDGEASLKVAEWIQNKMQTNR